MGFVYAQRGDFSQAIQAYSRALTYDESLRPAAEALAQLAKYGPPASRADGSTADAAAGEPEGSRLVYMMERKADSQIGQIRKDAHVRPASAEMVINSLTDEATASDILPPGRGESSVRYQGRREPLQLVPEPSVPGNFPTAWQPPLPTTPSVHAFSDSPPAPTQPPSGPTQASMPRPLSFSGLPAGPIVGNQRP
jgi:hypothetical protein